MARKNYTILAGIVHCYRDPVSRCMVAGFNEFEKENEFHDQELLKASKEINSILSETRTNNKDSRKELALLSAGTGLFLAWVNVGDSVIGPEDTEEIEKLFVRTQPEP